MINLKKLYVRYNLKREHVILLISALMAIVVVIAGIYWVEYEKQESRQKIIYSQSNTYVSEKNLTTKQTQEASQEPRNNLDQVIVFAVLVMIIPYSVETYVTARRIRRYEEEFIGFLYELSELLRGGFDPLGAIKEIASPTLESERSLHTITPHLQKAAAQIRWGVSFEDVISSMAESLNSPMISKYSYLIIQASRLGAINTNIILKSADDLEKTLQLEREKDAELKEYIIIIYAAQLILIGLIYILNSNLLPSLLNMMSTTGGSGASLGFGLSSSGMNIEKFKVGFFHVIMINALASGIIAGQLAEGKARHGLKHSVILMILSYTASLIFLLK